MTQQPCSEYYNHKGTYPESWAVQDLTPGVHLSPFQPYGATQMCLTIKNGALRVGTPLVLEACGGSIALGQEFDKLAATDGGAFLVAYAESGRQVDDPLKLSDYCVASHGGRGSVLQL